MKNIFTFFIIITIIFGACTAQTSRNAGWEGANKAYKGELYKKTETVSLYPEKKDSPALKFDVALLESEGALQTLLSEELYEGRSCDNYATSRWQTLKDMYSGMKSVAPSGTEYQASLNWSYSELGFGHFYPNFAVVKRVRDVFTGGAHGMSETNYFLFDTDNVKRVTLEDLIKSDAMPQLANLTEDTLLGAYAKKTKTPLKETTTLSDMGFFDDHVDLSYDTLHDNFYINKDGLNLLWNAYAIAPYALGIIEIKLPYKLIKDMLSADGEKVFANVR